MVEKFEETRAADYVWCGEPRADGRKRQEVLWSVGPSECQSLLARSKGNRSESKQTIEMFSELATSDRWETYAGEPCRIDENGTLRDYHHRLKGILKSGKHVTIRIVFNASESECRLTDMARQRSMKDLLTLQNPDDKTAGKRAAVAAGFQKLEHNGRTTKLLPHVYDDYARRFDEEIEWASSLSRVRVTQPIMVALAYSYTVDRNAADAFGQAISNDECVVGQLPYIVLRLRKAPFSDAICGTFNAIVAAIGIGHHHHVGPRTLVRSRVNGDLSVFGLRAIHRARERAGLEIFSSLPWGALDK